jgi:catalase
MPYEDAKTYRFNPFDLTKIWPHSDYPLIKVGTMTLNRTRQLLRADRAGGVRAVGARAGIGFSPDKDAARPAFAYSDTTAPIGPNYLQLPVNRPHVEVNTYTQDGPMAYEHRATTRSTRRTRSVAGTPTRSARWPDGWETDGADGAAGVHAAAGGRRLSVRPGRWFGRCGPTSSARRSSTPSRATCWAG